MRAVHAAMLSTAFMAALIEARFLPEGRLVDISLLVAVAATGFAAWRASTAWMAQPGGAAAVAAPGAAPAIGAVGASSVVHPVPGGPTVSHVRPAAAAVTKVPPASLANAPFPTAPVFSRSRAHQLPWQLPPRPANAGVLADEAAVGDLAVRAASVVGAGHRCEEPAGPRQDSYSLGRDLAGRYLVLAVADGVSSSPHADRGATFAAKAAVDLLVRTVNTGTTLELLDGRMVFGEVAKRMRASTAAQQLRATDFSCVAVVAVIETQPANGDLRGCWVSWLGDVSAWSRTADGWSHFAGDRKRQHHGVESGEILASLPATPEQARQELFDLPSSCTLAFVTDGLGDALDMEPDVNHYLASRWSKPPPVAAFLNDMSFEVHCQQDDRTAVVVWTPRERAS